jgi:hypothetical protein
MQIFTFLKQDFCISMGKDLTKDTPYLQEIRSCLRLFSQWHKEHQDE